MNDQIFLKWLWDEMQPDDEVRSPLGVARLYLAGGGNGNFPIVLESDGSTIEVAELDENYALTWEEICRRLVISAEPEEGDYVITDSRGGYFVTPLGETLPDYNRAIDRIRQQMDTDQFWPNVWLQDDHGGFTIIDIASPKEGG